MKLFNSIQLIGSIFPQVVFLLLKRLIKGSYFALISTMGGCFSFSGVMSGISYALVCLPVNQGAVIPVGNAVDLTVVV